MRVFIPCLFVALAFASQAFVASTLTTPDLEPQRKKEADKPPNIVLLFVDDLGINQIEVPAAQRAYGYTGSNHTIRTPHISQLASEGLVFQTWYSAHHVCSPSRASMLTGRLPIRSGVVPLVFTAEAIGGLPKNETTMAAAVGKVGYRSLAIGKWHVGQRDTFLPTNHGFDNYLGIPFSQDMGLSYWLFCAGPPTATGEPPACDPAPTGEYQPSPLPLLANTTVIAQPAGLYTLAKRYTAAATEFMEASADQGDPFLLYFAFNHVHAPSSCGEGFCGRSPRGPIGDATEEMDWSVGQVMDAIRGDPRIAENTLVIFTSDNGAPMKPDGNLPLRGYKSSIWEGGFREPGIAWWPGKVKAGSSSDALVATYDIFPTVVNLAGAALPEDVVLDGIDISHVLFSKTPEAESAHDCIMYYKSPEECGPAGAAKLTGLSAVRCGNYKVYWLIDGTSTTPLPKGINATGVLSLENPAIFDLSVDWSEDSPLDPSSAEWQKAKSRADEARLAHINTLTTVTNQIALGSKPEYAICSDPSSKDKYPNLPNCTISPKNWEPPICLVGGSIDQCLGQTSCISGCRFEKCSGSNPGEI